MNGFFDFVEWWNVKTFELRRGDENRPPTPDFSEHPVEWHSPFPAPSLRELSRPTGVTEGVSPVEWWNVKTFEFRRGDENRP